MCMSGDEVSLQILSYRSEKKISKTFHHHHHPPQSRPNMVPNQLLLPKTVNNQRVKISICRTKMPAKEKGSQVI